MPWYPSPKDTEEWLHFIPPVKSDSNKTFLKQPSSTLIKSSVWGIQW